MHDASHSHEPSTKRHRPATPTVFGAAFVAGAVAAFGINSFFDAHVARTRPQVESEPIFVALRSLPQGAPVTVWDVALRDWPRAMLPDSALRAEDRFEGLVLRHPLREGQPLLSVQLARPEGTAGETSSIHGSMLLGAMTTVPRETPETFSAPVPASEPPTAAVAATTAPQVRTVPGMSPATGSGAPETPAGDTVEVFSPVEPLTDPAPAPFAPAAAREESAVNPAPADGPTTEVATAVPEPSDLVDESTDTVPVRTETSASDPTPTTLESVVSQEPPKDGQPSPVTAPPVDLDVAADRDPDARPTDSGDAAEAVATAEASAPLVPVEPRVVTDDADRDVEMAVPDIDSTPGVETGVLPLPPVGTLAATLRSRAPVPAAPGSDIELPLAIASRQRLAQTAAKRPGSVLVSPDPSVNQSLPIPTTPTSDVALPLEAAAAERSRATAPQTDRTTTQPGTSSGSPAAPAVGGGSTPSRVGMTPTAPEQSTTNDATSGDRPEVVAPTAVSAPPLRHLVVPERIAMQADASFVSPRVDPVGEVEDSNAAPAATSQPTSQPTSQQTTQRQAASQTSRAAATTKPRTDRPTRPTPSSQDATGRSSSGPFMRAIGSMLQGFNSQPAPDTSRRR